MIAKHAFVEHGRNILILRAVSLLTVLDWSEGSLHDTKRNSNFIDMH